jgi:hypothetical protein
LLGALVIVGKRNPRIAALMSRFLSKAARRQSAPAQAP